jgi:pilus assembly protein Flp/PilA
MATEITNSRLVFARRMTCKKKSRGKMHSFSQLLRSLLYNDSGQDLIEYALIAALIAVASIAAMKGLTNKISNEFNDIGNSL